MEKLPLKYVPGPGDYDINKSTMAKNGPNFLKVTLNRKSFTNRTKGSLILNYLPPLVNMIQIMLMSYQEG